MYKYWMNFQFHEKPRLPVNGDFCGLSGDLERALEKYRRRSWQSTHETSFAVGFYFGSAKISVTTTFPRWHRFPKIWPKISGSDLTEHSSLNEPRTVENKRTQRDNVQQSRSLGTTRETRRDATSGVWTGLFRADRCFGKNFEIFSDSKKHDWMKKQCATDIRIWNVSLFFSFI